MVALPSPATAKPGLRRRKPRRSLDRLPVARIVAQSVIAAFLIYTGWQFAAFVAQFQTGGAVPFTARPAAVEAFLPISALVALRSWIGTGTFDTVHPAGLVIFLTIVLSSALVKKAFCAWICPVGALSEFFARAGRKVFGRNLRVPILLDVPLRGLKYLLLAFFLWAILLSMSGQEAAAFLEAPYNKVADVKMLEFFTSAGPGLAAFLVTLGLLSMLVSNFWCRYLCPYGALLGLASLLSPLKISRDPERCTDCGLCTKACPNRIEVARINRVRSPECSGCLECVVACHRKGALGVALPMSGRHLSVWLVPGLLFGAFGLAILAAQVTGHWQTSLSYADYARLIPLAPSLSH